MADLGRGDWVQCIRSETALGVEIVAGRTYYVEACKRAAESCGFCERDDSVLVLTGVTPPGTGWCSCGFKPLGGNAQERTAPPARVSEPA